MTIHLLGAETSQLEALANRLMQTGAEIDQVQTQTQSTADVVVAEMESSFTRALSSIEQSMQHLRSTVDAAHSQLADTTWTGANAATFQAGYGDFNGAMANFEAAVNDAYLQFDAQMRTVADTIAAFPVSSSISPTAAARSPRSAAASARAMSASVPPPCASAYFPRYFLASS